MTDLYRPSGRHQTRELGNLLDSSLNYNSDIARSKISNMTIDGEDLIDAFNCLTYIQKNYEEEVEKRQNLIKQINQTFEQKEGAIVDKIKKILEEYSD